MSGKALRVTAALGAAVLSLGACSSSSKPSARETSPSPGVSSASPAGTGAGWRSCAAARSSRQEVAAAAMGTQILVAGGLVDSGSNASIVESYDTTSDTWQPLPPLPIKVDHAMATAWRGKFVVLGGNGGTGREVLAFENGAWSTLPSLQRPRTAGAAVTVGDRIVVVGGVGPAGHVAPVEIFDGSRWRDGAPIPSLRDHLAAATDGRLVYTIGGRRDGGHFATHEAYEPAADRWQKMPDVPTARSGFGAAFSGGRIVTVGGEGPRIFPEVEAFDVAARTWTRLPDLGVPRHGVGIAAIGGKLYALVGGTQVGLGSSRSCEVLDL